VVRVGEYLVVKNFERFSTTKTRGSVPAWIKLHRALLHDDEFHAVPDKTKPPDAHLVLVSQRNDRRIRMTPLDAQQIGANEKIDLKYLVGMVG